MDLSVDKVSKLNKKINFQGLKSGYSELNAPVYKFYAPPFNSDNESVYLEIATLKTDEKTGFFKSPKKDDFYEYKFNGDEPLELDQKKLQSLTDAFAYRYKIVDRTGNERYITDNFKSIDILNSDGTKAEEKANIINQGGNYGIAPKTGSMYHAFIDANAILKDNQQGILSQDTSFVRNHFNKLGGSLKGLTYLLKNTDEFEPYRYIMSTPDIGVDRTSSHKYWPNNQYQCTNMDDFKEFVFEMYKQGKGYIADGAFTSQGIQSPMFQHVLKWGEESPFYNMFKIDSRPCLGILPDKSNDEGVNELANIGVKLVNNPYDKDYDDTKPVYIQLYDARLVSEEARLSDELIKQYDKSPDDHYDITTHQDSVIPYYFEIKDNDLNRLKYFKNGNKTIMLDQIKDVENFLNFPNFSIVSKAHASGANFWDGNRDIIKMNLSNPLGEAKNRKGFFDARNYLYGVASFWTETIQSDLIKNTALMSETEKKRTAINNDITKEKYEELVENLEFLDSPILSDNKTVMDFIEEFPLQQIETSPELSAIFSEPEFKEEFLDDETVDYVKSRVDSVIENVIPDKYKNDDEYKTYVVKLYTPQILKNIYASALCPDSVKEDGKYDLDILNQISLASLGANHEVTPEDERKRVVHKLHQGLNYSDTSKIENSISKELSNISLDDFKLSEAIVLQGRAGLNWRFDAAKDVGDLDAVRNNETTFHYVWKGDGYTPGVEDFWTKFVSNIKKYNPSSYIITEITNMHDFTKYGLQKFHKNAPENINSGVLSAAKEAEFLENTGSTTSSNYSFYFNKLSMFVGVNPEERKDKDKSDNEKDKSKTGNVDSLRKRIQEVLNNSQPNAAILSHTFVDNHDKPRVLHTLPLDTALFLNGDDSNQDEYGKRILSEFKKANNANYSCSQALAVGLMMYKEIDKIQYYDDDKENNLIKDKLKKSLTRFVNGNKPNSNEFNYRRALAFGTLPYEVTIRDVFNDAGIYDEEKIKDFHFSMLKSSIEKEVVLWQMMNAIVGTPTLYNGSEFFQTGYETPSKNKYVANRNQVLHELKDDKRYKPYYDEIQSVLGLYKTPDMSAIRDGFPILLDTIKVGEDKNSIDALPIYKYDEKGSKVLALITNNGLPHEYSDRYNVKTGEYKTPEIKIEKDGAPLFKNGTTILRKVFKDGNYVTENKEYIVQEIKTKDENGKEYTYSAIKSKDGSDIIFNSPVEYFYEPSNNVKYRIR